MWNFSWAPRKCGQYKRDKTPGGAHCHDSSPWPTLWLLGYTFIFAFIFSVQPKFVLQSWFFPYLSNKLYYHFWFLLFDSLFQATSTWNTFHCWGISKETTLTTIGLGLLILFYSIIYLFLALEIKLRAYTPAKQLLQCWGTFPAPSWCFTELLKLVLNVVSSFSLPISWDSRCTAWHLVWTLCACAYVLVMATEPLYWVIPPTLFFFLKQIFAKMPRLSLNFQSSYLRCHYTWLMIWK